MNTLEVLERLKLFTEDWAVEFNRTCGKPQGEAYRLSKKAYFDFKSLKVQIEKSLEKEAEEMHAHYNPDFDHLSHENQK